MTSKKNFGSTYWRISAAFMVLLAMVAIAHVYITARSSRVYFEQVNQTLNWNTARDICLHSSPFINGRANDTAISEMFHNIMMINPSLEVYLLDKEGNILTYYAPEKKVVLKKISLAPINEFIHAGNKTLVRGEDPRHAGLQKVFSAAPVLSNGALSGYLYVVLAGEQYDTVITYLRSHYMLEVGSKAMVATLFFALIIGLVMIRIITKNLRKVIDVMHKFRQGDLKARIGMRGTGDIRELSAMFNEMADILTQNVQRLKEVEVLRRELIANISHDLRTPISIIHGYVETLQMKNDSLTYADRKHYLNTIYVSTQKLEKLVNELFELSKLEANQVQPVREPFFISELINDISNKYRLAAKEKGITLSTELFKEVQPVFADVSLIERAVQNLIDNALKFTPNGGTIIIQTRKGKEGIEVAVSDTGIGIADTEQEFVFERYYTGHNTNKHQSNTGLGLAIAKKILDLHDSSLVIQSKLNKGSSFAFELPLHQ